MKKFRFQLQKVMDVREEKEKKKILDLAEAEKVACVEEEKLNVLKGKDRFCREYMESIKSERINPAEMNNCYRYLKKLGNAIEQQNHRLDKANREKENKRQELVDASRERKVLEKLKEKRFRMHVTEQEKKEQMILDEVALTRAVRKARESG